MSFVKLSFRGPTGIQHTIETEVKKEVENSNPQVRENFVNNPRDRTLDIFGSFSPSTYYQVAKYSPFIVPHPNKALTDVQKNRFMELARYMGFSVSEEKPYLFPSAMLLADKATTHETWKLHPSPWVQFYLRECPGYGETEGMLVTLPVTLPRFLFSAGIFVAKRMALWLGFQKHSRQKIEEKLSRQLPKQ